MLGKLETLSLFGKPNPFYKELIFYRSILSQILGTMYCLHFFLKFFVVVRTRKHLKKKQKVPCPNDIKIRKRGSMHELCVAKNMDKE
jgi:hypothetical protein